MILVYLFIGMVYAAIAFVIHETMRDHYFSKPMSFVHLVVITVLWPLSVVIDIILLFIFLFKRS